MLGALRADRVENLALLLAGGLVLMAVVLLLLVRAVVGKVLLAAALLGLGVFVWSQRARMQDCVERAGSPTTSADTAADTPCEFLGVRVDVSVP